MKTLPSTLLYLRRSYRNNSSGNLDEYEVRAGESDLKIMTHGVFIEEAAEKLSQVRNLIERDIVKCPELKSSMTPLKPSGDMSGPVVNMIEASRLAGVGPMAAVAGLIAGEVGAHLLRFSTEVIVENGGDIFLKSDTARLIAVFAGDSPLSMKIGIRVASVTGMGVCASSGTVGHSLSGGSADAVLCLSGSPALADAAATAAANLIHTPADIKRVLEKTLKIRGIRGCLAVMGETLGAAGDIVIEEI